MDGSLSRFTLNPYHLMSKYFQGKKNFFSNSSADKDEKGRLCHPITSIRISLPLGD